MKAYLPSSYKNLKYKASIVIVNFNTGNLLKECLASIDKSTNNFKNPITEVILVDNASSDESVLKIGDYKNDNNIKIIGNSENVGFAKAVNQGIGNAGGEYVFLLNPDCKMKDNVLQKLIEYSENHLSIGALGPKLLNSDGSIQTSVMPFPGVVRAFKEFFFGIKVYSKYTPKVSIPTNVDAVVMAAFLITPEALKRVGKLNEKYFMYFEDIEYCSRLHKEGLSVIYFPGAEVIHHHGVSGRKILDYNNQWKRLIPSSKLYHGPLKHYIINFVIWFGSRILHRESWRQY